MFNLLTLVSFWNLNLRKGPFFLFILYKFKVHFKGHGSYGKYELLLPLAVCHPLIFHNVQYMDAYDVTYFCKILHLTLARWTITKRQWPYTYFVSLKQKCVYQQPIVLWENCEKIDFCNATCICDPIFFLL